MSYVRSVATHSLGAEGSRLVLSGCSPELGRLIERRLQSAQIKLEAARAQLASGGRSVRQILKENFLDDSKDTRNRVLARVTEAANHARRALEGKITIECSQAADCCGGSRPACIIPERGLDRIFVCIPNLRKQDGGAVLQEQILIHELFHRAGLSGPQMHTVEIDEIDCVRKERDHADIVSAAKAGINLFEVVDLHVRAVWCLVALGSR